MLNGQGPRRAAMMLKILTSFYFEISFWVGRWAMSIPGPISDCRFSEMIRGFGQMIHQNQIVALFSFSDSELYLEFHLHFLQISPCAPGRIPLIDFKIFIQLGRPTTFEFLIRLIVNQ